MLLGEATCDLNQTIQLGDKRSDDLSGTQNFEWKGNSLCFSRYWALASWATSQCCVLVYSTAQGNWKSYLPFLCGSFWCSFDKQNHCLLTTLLYFNHWIVLSVLEQLDEGWESCNTNTKWWDAGSSNSLLTDKVVMNWPRVKNTQKYRCPYFLEQWGANWRQSRVMRAQNVVTPDTKAHRQGREKFCWHREHFKY